MSSMCSYNGCDESWRAFYVVWMRSSWSSVEKVNWVSTLTTPTQTYSKIPWEYWLRTIAPAEHKERKRDSIITAIKLIEYSALVFELQITRNIFWQSFLMDDDAPNGCTRPKCQRISNKTQTNAHIYQQQQQQQEKSTNIVLSGGAEKKDRQRNKRTKIQVHLQIWRQWLSKAKQAGPE